MNSILNRRKILLIAFLIETICVTYALKLQFLISYTSVVYAIAGLFICWFALVLPSPEQIPNQPLDLSKTTNRYRWWILAMTLICIIGSALHWMEDAPLDYHDADMLPIIKIMSERFIHGAWNQVYDVIPEIWGGMHPIYLPAMWLPFSIPVFFDADPRWTTVIALFILTCLFIWRIQPLHRKSAPIFFAAFLLIWWLLNARNSGLLIYTEEGVVILFYSFLALALFSKNGWLIGMATSLCVLSRYSLVGWIPAMLVFYIYIKDFKNLLRITLMGILFFMVLVLIPFGWKTFLTLTSIPSEYISFSERVWRDQVNNVVFYQSLGFAKFFGPKNIALQHHLLIISALTIPTVFMVICLTLVKRFHLQRDHLPIATLKITLVIFYTLVDVPYLYLFYTGSFLSLFLVTNLLVGERPIWTLKKTD
jgi:hypothetical protein